MTDPLLTPPPVPLPSDRPGRRLRLIAWAVAAMGLTAAAVVYFFAANSEPDAVSYRIIGGQAYASADSSGADRQSERLGGKALVRTAAFDRWLGSLVSGRPLAGTLAVLSLVVAAVCFYIAGLMDEAEPAEEHTE